MYNSMQVLCTAGMIYIASLCFKSVLAAWGLNDRWSFIFGFALLIFGVIIPLSLAVGVWVE